MSFDADLTDIKTRFEKGLNALSHDFNHIRTGRATPALIEHVQVEVYGAFMPITQVATISVPDASTLMIKPWDKGNLKAIDKALTAASLGMNPQNDGVVVRLNLPPLSTERRKQLAAQAKEATEKCKVSMRNVRRDGIKAIETKGKADKLPEDQVKKAVEKVNDLLKQYEQKAEAALKAKSDDILNF